MKLINYIKRNKYLALVFACLSFLAAGIITLCCGGTNVFVHAAELEDDSVSNQAYLSAHYTDGTMGTLIDESYGLEDSVVTVAANANLEKTTVRSSGLPDAKSIVAVFLGDGFTKNEQQVFVDRVKEISDYMVTVEPFNYYKDYLTVYAVHSISNESGVSGEVNGVFACRNSAGNPATAKCTPVDSPVFNCEHGRDTYYHSYYQWRSSADRVILEMTSVNRARARQDAFNACASVDMIQIIANSQMRGGTGEMPTKTQPIGVALTSVNSADPNGDWKQVVMHEFGHAFGGLWDEYWNGLTPDETWPNITKNSNPSTVKWSQYVGREGIGVYPFAASERDGNPDQATKPWYRPHQSCIMRQTTNPFCLVCTHVLLDKMENKTGVSLDQIVFTVTVHYSVPQIGEFTREAHVRYGEMMPLPNDSPYAPSVDGYTCTGIYSAPNGQGTKYYSMELQTGRKFDPVSSTYYTIYYEGIVPVRAWDHYGDGDLYFAFELLELDYTYYYVADGEGILREKTVHIKHDKPVTLTAESVDKYKFSHFERKYQTYTSKTVTWTFSLERDERSGEICLKNDYFFVAYEQDSCLAAGTLITLADGSQKPVEELTGNEMLLVWNLFTGSFDIAPILFIDSDAFAKYKVVNLTFSDETTVKVIGEHGFWDCNLNRYVYLDKDAAQYIGHWFCSQTTDENGNMVTERVQLMAVTIQTEMTAAYSPVTYGHLCYFVNGMLSMPGGISGLFNIFEVDAETMSYDWALMQAEIEEYGLFTYEEFAAMYPISEEIFDAFNGQYLKVSIGKGFIDYETLGRLIERYSNFF